MEQRRLRLGDILDDYCPRERRVTNHAIVAMIEEDIKQTRCTTCDAEHAYKGGKLPRRRKKETPSALYKEVLAGLPETEGAPVLAAPVGIPVHVPEIASPLEPEIVEPAPVVEAVSDHTSDHTEDHTEDLTPGPGHDEDGYPRVDEGPVHRRLIRATLPRPEGQKDARPLPEFTVRHSGNRPGNNGQFRNGRPARGQAAGGNGNGNRGQNARHQGPRGGHGRPGAGRGAQGRGDAGGFRGRKRSR